jgi:hypothetical protein
MSYWSFVLAGLGLVQLWMSGSKRRSGFVVGMVTSVGWFWYGLDSAQFGFLVSAVVFFVVHVRNFVRWSK